MLHPFVFLFWLSLSNRTQLKASLIVVLPDAFFPYIDKSFQFAFKSNSLMLLNLVSFKLISFIFFNIYSSCSMCYNIHVYCFNKSCSQHGFFLCSKYWCSVILVKNLNVLPYLNCLKLTS